MSEQCFKKGRVGLQNPKMFKKIPVILYLCINFAHECIKGDPGRDLCKIVSGPGVKCSKVSSYFFPYDTFLSFNDDLPQFTTEMKYLEMENSNITVLQTKSFQSTPHLSHLLLSNMYLMEIEPGAFEGLRRLKLVDLSRNLLQTIPVDAFKYTKLNRLSLDGNALLEIPADGPIIIAKFLTSLSLKNCNIQQLPESAFKQNPALIHLELGENYLKTLPSGIFSNLEHLIWIDLSGNQFRTLDYNIFKSMPFFPNAPTTVILSENPWVCDCRIAKLGDWLSRNIKTGAWSETPRLSRLKKLVECQQPKRISWNTNHFKDLISSC